MVSCLDFLFQEEIGEETEFERAFALFEEQARVYALRFRHEHVCVAEIRHQTVAYEDAAEVEQQPEFLVGDFQVDGRFVRRHGVEVADFDAGILRHVVDDGFVDGDVVVDERYAFVWPAATEGGDAAETLADWTGDFLFAVGVDVEGFALEDDEFGVDGYVRAWGGYFDIRFEGEAFGVGDDARCF